MHLSTMDPSRIILQSGVTVIPGVQAALGPQESGLVTALHVGPVPAALVSRCR